MSDDFVTIDRPLYLTEDGGRVVHENHPRARWLHWTKGMRVKRSEYEQLYRPTVTVELPKQSTPRPNKSRRPTGNK
jgi:hypothetical protein